jgi:uncharacterized membrane protein YbhN (UPF0104 family)
MTRGFIIDIPVALGADHTTTPLLPPLALPRQRRSTGASHGLTHRIPPSARRPIGAATAHRVTALDIDVVGRLRRLGRPRRRTLLLAALVAVPLVVLAVRFRTGVLDGLSDVPAPRWHWLVLCTAASAAFYVVNGVALRAASGLRLTLPTATAVQLAAAAANRVVPAGLGAIAVNLRFLEKRGLPRPAGLAAVASIKAAGALVHLAGIAAVAGTLQDSGAGAALSRPLRATMHGLGMGPAWGCCAAIGLCLGGTVAHPWVRARVRPAVRTFRGHLAVLAHSPGRAAVLVASLAGTKVAQIAALTATVWAFGGRLTVMSVAAVYLVGSAVAGAAPTAGNVGALEPALAIGLAAAGGTAAPMLAAVLVYRLISYWLPVLPGVVAITALRRQDDL